MELVAALSQRTRRLLAVAAAAFLAWGTATDASADAAAGATYFAANCTAGCHSGGPTSPYTAPRNAGNASNIISYALSQGMSGVNPTAQQLTDLADYINTFVSSPFPNNTSIPFNSGGASFTTLGTQIVFPTSWGALNALASVTAPTKGSITFSGTNVRYTPTACAVGADSFQYRGTGPGGNTSTRTGTVTISNPVSGPTISTASFPNGVTGTAYSQSVAATPCAAIITYSIVGGALPTGLSMSAAGAITGTPTAVATFNFTVRATYTGGAFTDKGLSITVTLGAPAITSGATATNGAVGVAYAPYTITASNSPTSYSIDGATPLPPGLTLNTGTGAITGTPTDASGSPYIVNVQATNATGTGSRAVTFRIVPAITSAATASGQTGVAFNYQITEGAGPAFTSHAALDPLPAGLTLAAGSGLISGTPTAVGGPTNVRLTGSNADGTSAQFTLAITITLGPPVITSSLTANGGEAVPFNYQITATNAPHTSFNATGLPAGLTVDTTTGLISGTPNAATGGVYPVQISATNATGTGMATLTLTISSVAPVITSAGTASGVTGTPFSYQITANFGPTSFAATNLPPGVTIDTTTGLISGTPTTPGTFNGTITATNGSGSDVDPIVYTITLGAPVITSPGAAGGSEGAAFSYQITATNSPTSFGATGLPAGITVNPTTGLISGTPTVVGTFNATISATNATATANQALTITIGIGAPVITSGTTASGGTGVAFAYQITATNGPTSFGASGLPPGLSVDTTTGRIAGTPTASGSFPVNLSATNGTGTGTRLLTITISLRPPTVPPAGTITGTVGVNFSYAIQPGNGATAFSAENLPPGLAINTASGLITGVPTVGGQYDATISITNAAGTTTLSLRFMIGFLPPTAADVSLEVVFQTPTAIALPVTGEAITVNIVVLPQHGLVTVEAGSATVTYTPAIGYSGPDTFSYTVSNAAGTTSAATVNIVVGTLAPVGVPVTFTAQVNTATTVDFTGIVPGSGLTGISILSSAAHGTVFVNGMNVTYTPRTDYFGPDSFTYIAFGNAGTSTAATVTVDVVGRPDPTADRDVVGLIDAQNQAARRFAGAQIGNYQRRMESLHRTPIEPAAEAPPPAPSAPARPQALAAPARLAANDASGTRSDAPSLVPVSLINTLMTAVTSRSVGINHATVNGNGAAATTAPEFWIAGTANFGRRDATGERSGLEFGTDGISVGADRRFGDRLAMGIGFGYAQDDTDVGTGRTRSRAKGASIAAYGSYQPSPRTFIDLLVGYGHLRFDSDRYVEAVDDIARGRRKGHQVFGSVAAGYELRRENLLISPYGRIDFSADRLDAVTEEGAGSYALAYGRQNQRTVQAAVGVRAESKHETEYGWAVPRVRAEYRREFEGDRNATLAYADLFGGTEYTVRPAGTSRNSLLLGVGTDFVMRGGLRIGVDYTAQRASGSSNVQGIRLMVSQDLDALGAGAWRFEPVMFKWPVTVDGGYAWDDNVNRSRESGERLSDNIFSLSVNQSRPFALGTNGRLQLTALASAEKFDRYQGLGRFSGGAQAELQYRSSGAYDATTFGLVGRALYERYESDHRTGPRYFVGLNARRALTDRIEVFAELGANWRDGRSEVFRWRDYSAKLNLDYSLGRRGIVYLTGEYRKGDTVSSGFASLVNVGLAEVFVADDAFEDLGLIAYRFDARSVFGTLGWNLPLGPRDSLDFSWRRIQSTPTRRPDFDFSGSLRYIDNQYSIVYLMRF